MQCNDSGAHRCAAIDVMSALLERKKTKTKYNLELHKRFQTFIVVMLFETL